MRRSELLWRRIIERSGAEGREGPEVGTSIDPDDVGDSVRKMCEFGATHAYEEEK